MKANRLLVNGLPRGAGRNLARRLCRRNERAAPWQL